MIRSTLLACALTCVPVVSAAAQAPGGAPTPPPPGDPAAWIAERFFARDSFPERVRYYTGEMLRSSARPTMGAWLHPEVVRGQPRLAARDSLRAVYTVTVTDSAWTSDWYLHFQRVEGAWKLAAVRTLWIPAIFEEMLGALDDPRAPEELRRDSAALRLVMQPDSVLRAHFAAHADDFAAIARFAAEHPGLRGSATEEKRPAAERATWIEAGRLLRAASAQTLERDGRCLIVGIGGMIDNHVGFLHATPGCTVPEMSPAPYIYVERVAPGWYLFKTT